VIGGLYFEEHGPADAPAVILSPGLGGSAAYWRPNLASLVERYRVILYDHRGTGRSDRALPRDLTVDHMAADLLALMDGLGLNRAHVVGHAAGALIGLALAVQAPRRLASLVAVNGWSRLDSHTARCFEARLALLRDSGVRAYLRAQPLFLFPATWISEHRDELDRELDQQLAQFPGIATMEARIAALQSFYLDDQLDLVRAPLLALAAKDDMLVPYTASLALAEGVERASVELMDWGGHACNVTDARNFNRILRDWLAGAPSDGVS
jgi:aminoacrylate hydrolase